MAVDTEIMNGIKALTNRELFTKLRDMGFDNGPVTKTTRIVYEKKLYRAMTQDTPQADQIIGDQLSSTYDDDDDDDDEVGDDDDDDVSSFIKRSALKGSGDFHTSSKLFVEDSHEEEEEEEEEEGDDDDDDDKDKYPITRLVEQYTERFKHLRSKPLNVTSTSISQAEDDDDDEDDGHDDDDHHNWVTKEKRVTHNKLYPELKDTSEKETVDYYLEKYGPKDDDPYYDGYKSPSSNIDELRRRPLDSVRETPKREEKMTSKFIRAPEKFPPHNFHSIDVPSKNTPSTVLSSELHRYGNGVVKAEVGDTTRRSVTNELWKLRAPIAVALIFIFFFILVFLSMEPEQELPKLDIIGP